MTVTQVAAVLGISRTTAYECVRTGDLPALRLGGRIVVPTKAIDDLLDRVSSTNGTRAPVPTQSDIIDSTVAAASREIPGVTCE